ncbi:MULTISPECIES: dicarboxylate/amino acid:cation symporter [unclassified Phenylobacterium]|uniref:dicarboxylate/amino acid:cation symporter n=1 Tax=unclassified Phenylobacterium TaxID=2640670 RepID=UPI0022B3ECD9|nr:dicarboxylate/amino acid:cation symporter [Phenylobacterium sp. NIBR 498073]MBS0489238.1 dicarboxylate/amino acid:cation symporter [Pseudomonadota bacterium]WGU39096.1 dicarboxylate/amino acid:cation symporter [Phenylobacterium sp. NIBR 498073]
MAQARKRGGIFASFGFQVLAGMALGLGLGLLARQLGSEAGQAGHGLSEALRLAGATFIQLLRVLVPPLVFTAIVASIANLRELQNAAALVWRTLFWFAATALIAVSIGIVLGLALKPGLNTTVAAAAAGVSQTSGSWLDFLTGLVPSNMLGLAASTTLADDGAKTTLSFNVLQIVVISLVTGIAALKSGAAAEPFLAFNASALAIVRKILWWVIRLTPIGTIGLFGNAVAHYGWDALAQLGAFALAVYAGLGLVLFVVYPTLLLANGLNPLKFFAGAWPAIQLGFVSRSSIGTLPVTQTVAESALGVPRSYAAFAVPLGATTKMDGCAAIYPAVAAIFVAQFYNVPLAVSDYFLIVFVSVIGSAATAGLTGAVVMLTLTLSTLGLPLEGVGLLLAIDPILDMGRTATNVAGQALVPTLVAKQQGMLNMEVYNAASGDLPTEPDQTTQRAA